MPSRAEEWPMPIRHRALLRVFLEIVTKPGLLLVDQPREFATVQDLAVQCDDVPFADVVAVPSFTCWTGLVTEVLIVAFANARFEIMIPRRRTNDLLYSLCSP